MDIGNPHIGCRCPSLPLWKIIMNKPYDLNGSAYKDLPNRLEKQAQNVEKDGWLNAARLMRNAADVLRELHEKGIIELKLYED